MCNAMVEAKLIAHVSGKQVEFTKSQQLFRFVDETWFSDDNKKFEEATQPTGSW